MSLGPRIFLPFAGGYLLSYLLRNFNAVIAPELTRELGLSSADLGLLTSAYLLAFAAFQLPLGVLMDRYGPRRVQTVLLLVTAAGCALYALGTAMSQLAIARAAIGLGVSGCLMSSFTTFSRAFPAERLPSLNAAVMVAGGVGALAATTPLAWAMPLTGWRPLMFALAVLSAAAALAVNRSPETATASTGESIGQQVKAMASIMRSRAFWRYAPQSATAAGGFMAMQGLWAIPWLMETGGWSRDAAAFHLLLLTGTMTLSLLALAVFIVPLRRRGISPGSVLAVAMGTGLAAMIAIVLDLAPSHVLWCFVGAAFSCSNLAYSQLAGQFPQALAGRANTALNLAAFAGAFAIQWSYGALLDGLAARGWTAADAHRAAFGSLVVLQAAGFGWFLLGGRKAV
jgi:MFS family permease